MDDEAHGDVSVAAIAAAIGEPARARMLYGLMDGHARTSTELAVIADVGAPTASAHLGRLRAAGLVGVVAQGKHRYYRLAGPDVAAVLEGLNVLAGAEAAFRPNTPRRLRAARTCYDHMAGAVGVALHDRLQALQWLAPVPGDPPGRYDVTPSGAAALEALGVDVAAAHAQRRRFACACLDWSERRPHLGGALGAALLSLALRRRWLEQDLDSRALSVTSLGRRELASRFGAHV
ncbi:MAG TPA: helix-turn-helix domain-containing protein [Caulobacteraceae bacterium]|nr:helix-turn-helix domain-containing protein [Caulobacteraceae bacterium]